jgi:eukaryotic-like serine/threonine-protein kinase
VSFATSTTCDRPQNTSNFRSCVAAGRTTEALNLRQQALELRKAKLGPDHPDTLLSMASVASSRLAMHQLESALPLAESALQGIEKLGFKHPNGQWIMSVGVQAFERAGQLDGAEAWQRKWTDAVKKRAGSDSVAFAAQEAALADLLLRQRKYADAESVLRECLAVRDKKQFDAWSTFAARGLLGAALLGQKNMPRRSRF